MKEVTNIPQTNRQAAIDEAFEKIKGDLGPILKTSNNPFFKSKYADLNEHLKVVEPIIAKYGCTLRQPTKFVQGENVVVSEIVHTKSGQAVSASLGLGQQPDMQKLGSAITYARRYTLGALLSLQAEDDDGNGATGKVVKTNSKTKKGDF